MGRKKKRAAKPWCWYCNREFEDDKILIQHQKAKHFKCHICNKKLFTGPGLAIHCMQVHKETIDKIPGAIPGRDSVDVEVYGMDGIPQEYEGPAESKQPKLAPTMAPILPTTAAPIATAGGMPFAVPGMVQPNPYMAHYYGMVPGQIPRPALVPTIPLPQSIPTPAINTQIPSRIPLPTPIQLPQQVNYPHYQPRSSTENALPVPSAVPTTSAKALSSKTRIIVPDEDVSLEELMSERLENLSRARY